jgi:uncharacterized BrkB/YihY/UPF0761 family membrane protein
MKIKSRIHFSAIVSICWGVVGVPIVHLVIKYVEHIALPPLWLVILHVFLHIVLGFIFLYAFFSLLYRIHLRENRNRAK